MSTAIDRGIYRRLVGEEDLTAFPDAAAAQVALATYIPVDPKTARLAVYKRWQRGVQMSCVTFRTAAGKPDSRSFKETGAVDDIVYDFEIWEGPDITRTDGKRSDGKAVDGSFISRIFAQLEQLLDVRRGAPPLPLASGKVFDHQSFVPLQELYYQDDKGNLPYGLWRLYFKECRF